MTIEGHEHHRPVHDEAAEKAVADAIEREIDRPASIEEAEMLAAAEIEEIETRID